MAELSGCCGWWSAKCTAWHFRLAIRQNMSARSEPALTRAGLQLAIVCGPVLVTACYKWACLAGLLMAVTHVT